MSRSPERLGRLADIADRFDAVILDQWGVLHDGSKAPPGAVAAVNAMATAGKRLVVLSNSARLGEDASERLTALGYDVAKFTGFVTSGETVRDMLRDRTDPFFAGLGRKVLLIAREPTLIDGLDYEAADPETADFILFGSSTAPEMSLARHHAPVLARAAARGIPAICANPDRVGVSATGLIEAPGGLAAHYEDSLGGAVRYIGKPYPEVYARCKRLLDGIAPGRTLAVGDSLEHDIAGGRKAGCLTAFVEQGIHADDLTAPDGLDRLCRQFAVAPDFVIPRLVW